MNPLLKNLAAAAVLASTAVLLVADSARECSHAAKEATFDVTQNTCGQAGTLRVSSAEDSCDLDVETEDATGLPRSGNTNRDDDIDLLAEGHWYLSSTAQNLYVGPDGGYVSVDAGGATPVNGSRSCETTREGEALRLRCTDRHRTDLPEHHLATCEALLTPR
ncbi:hypothetical protein ACLESO_29180 [Pyxidicoccus sp. 3LG]